MEDVIQITTRLGWKEVIGGEKHQGEASRLQNTLAPY